VPSNDDPLTSFDKNGGSGAQYSQPIDPFDLAAASHAGMHWPSKQPSSGGHVMTTLPFASTTACKSAVQPLPWFMPPPTPEKPPKPPP
jgi:hypothetical protein